LYRNLRFTKWSEVEEEITKLENATKVEATGLWSYAQVCDHLSGILEFAYIESPKQLPWIVKVTLGKWFKKSVIKTGYFKPGGINPDAPKTRVEGDGKASLAKLKKAVADFQAYKGEIKENPFMGKLTREESEKINIYHIAHHLSYLNY